MKCSWFASAAAGDSVAAIAELPNPLNEAAGTKFANQSGKGGVLFPKSISKWTANSAVDPSPSAASIPTISEL